MKLYKGEKIYGRNSSLGVVEVKGSWIEFGTAYGYRRYVDVEGVELDEDSNKVQAYKTWAKEEWNRFAEIANRDGIPAGMRETSVR